MILMSVSKEMEEWFKKCNSACSKLQPNCDFECIGIGYCDEVAEIVEREGKKNGRERNERR